MTVRSSNASRRVRSQGGYILATVLGLMVLTTILLGALLALTQSTMLIESTGKVRERQARAAESAVQVAINQIRNSDTIATANPLNRKKSGDPGYLTGQPSYMQPIAVPGDQAYTVLGDPNINRGAAGGVCIPPSQLINVDGFPIRVFCYPDGLWPYDQNGNTVPGIPQDDGAPAVRLVGDQYVGDTSYSSFTDVAANWKTTFPFSTAMSGFNQGEINATKGQFLYTGSTPMKIVGGLQVRNQIAAVSSGTGPALEVQGAARQGGKGMFDNGTGPTDCGIAKSDDPYSSPKADIKINSLFVPLGEGLECNQADMASMAQTGTTSPNGEWDNDRVQRNRYNTDWRGDDATGGYTAYLNNANVPTDCGQFQDSVTHGQAHVISVAAGAYDSKATATLNNLFTACNNMTWIFPGGDYWFDVNDTTKTTSDPARNSLMLNNRTSNWVFGPPVSNPILNDNGNYAPDNFPDKACDHGFASPADGSRGTSITLSSRTGVFHRAGRVAICGPIGVMPAGWNDLNNPNSYPGTTSQSTAIFQRPSTSLGARLLPSGLIPGDFTAGTAPLNAATIQSDDGQQIQAQQWMPYQWWNGTSTFTKTFTATGFGQGGPNGAYGGPSPVSSVWVDVTGSGDRVTNASQDLTKTRLDVTLADNSTCWTEYGPNRSEARRLPSNNTVTSYNLLDSTASGTCKTLIASGTTRDKFYGAKIQVTFTLNPPYMRNTKFSWWDWWPWMRDKLEQACRIYDAWGIGDWLNNHIGLIDWYWRCDDRPSQVTYSVNSIVMRLGWSPNMGTPVNASDGPPLNPGCPNCIAVQNAANAVMVNPDGTLNQPPTYPDASITMPQGFAYPTSFSTLRYTLTDPTLLDGFLPLQSINFGYKITKVAGFQGTGGLDKNDSNVVEFTLKQSISSSGDGGIWCRWTEQIDNMNGSVQTSGTLTPSAGVVLFAGGREVRSGCIHKLPGAGMTLAVDNSNLVTEADVGDFISAYDHPTGGNLVPRYLDVSVIMSNRVAATMAKTLNIDFVNLSATAGDMQGSNLVGYPKPKDPFTVTWSPMTPNTNGDGANGDASFNVWGSVSVPNNDVRVIWNYDQTRYAGQLGFPIFNSGKQPFQRCNPQSETQCQPALVAAALGSWTTMTNNGYPVSGSWPTLTPKQTPDPLASTGNVRLPYRKVRIEACVVDSSGSGLNGDLLPRVMAEIMVGDRDGRAVVTGANVWTQQWQARRNGGILGADALTTPCATLS